MHKFILLICFAFFSCNDGAFKQPLEDGLLRSSVIDGYYYEVISEDFEQGKFSAYYEVVTKDNVYRVEKQEHLKSGDRVRIGPGRKLVKNPKLLKSENEIKEYNFYIVLADYLDIKSSQSLTKEALELKINQMKQYFESVGRGTIKFNFNIEVVEFDRNFEKTEAEIEEAGENTECDFTSVLQEAKKDSLVYDTDLHDYFMLVTSRDEENNGCGASGRAQLGGHYSYVRSHNLRTYIHEFGHNIGLLHAARDIDQDGEIAGNNISEVYGDFSDPMSNSSVHLDEATHFNSVHSLKLGIAQSFIAELDQVYTLDTLSSETASIEQTVALIEINEQKYYLSYRTDTDNDHILTHRSLKGRYIGFHVHTDRLTAAPFFGGTDSQFLGSLQTLGETMEIDGHLVELLTEPNGMFISFKVSKIEQEIDCKLDQYQLYRDGAISYDDYLDRFEYCLDFKPEDDEEQDDKEEDDDTDGEAIDCTEDHYQLYLDGKFDHAEYVRRFNYCI